MRTSKLFSLWAILSQVIIQKMNKTHLRNKATDTPSIHNSSIIDPALISSVGCPASTVYLFTKFFHQLMHFHIQLCISLLSYIKIT
jgi:hypothetical protein